MLTAPNVSSRARNAPSAILESSQSEVVPSAPGSRYSSIKANGTRARRSVRALALVTFIAAFAGTGLAMYLSSTTTEVAKSALVEDAAVTPSSTAELATSPVPPKEAVVPAIAPVIEPETPAFVQPTADVTPEATPAQSQASIPVVIPTSAPMVQQAKTQAPVPAPVVAEVQVVKAPEIAPGPLPSPQSSAPALAPVAQNEPRPELPPLASVAAPILTVPAGYSTYVSTNGCLPGGGDCPFGPAPSNYYWAPTTTAVVFTGQSAWTHQHEACHAHQHLTIMQELGVQPSMPYDLHEWLTTSEGRAWAGQVSTMWPATGQWAREPGAHNAIEDFGISCGLYFSNPQELRQLDPARYAAVVRVLS